MSSEWLVDESRIPGVYSPTEISTLRGLVQCPKCKTYGPAYVYIFEHLFTNVEDLEYEIEELSKIGSETPFLLLENTFARDVHTVVKKAISSAKTLQVGSRVFRARLELDVLKSGQSPADYQTFGPAPARFVGEGRFNHAGCPVIYVADEPDLAAAEIGQPTVQCLVGELEVTRPLKFLDLLEFDEEAPGFELMNALACSALLAAPHTGEGWVKQQYVFSRFVSDCARSAGFDAIRYGSTKLPTGSNFVILANVASSSDFLRLVGCSSVICSEPAKRY